MLGKLFKYDMAALSRTLVPLNVAALGFVLIGCMAGFSGHMIDETVTSTGAYTQLSILVLVVLFSMLALFASLVATYVLVLSRFYRNLFTDEGYLTLTLPVTVNQIVLSKVLSGLLWVFASVALVLVGITLISLSYDGFSTDGINSTISFFTLSVLGGNLLSPEWGSVLVGLANGICQAAYGLLLAYLSLVLGARVARYHKVAAGIGIYFLISLASSLVESIAAFVTTPASVASSVMGSSAYYEMSSFLSALAGWILTIVLAVICYALCVHFLEKAELA